MWPEMESRGATSPRPRTPSVHPACASEETFGPAHPGPGPLPAAGGTKGFSVSPARSCPPPRFLRIFLSASQPTATLSFSLTTVPVEVMPPLHPPPALLQKTAGPPQFPPPPQPAGGEQHVFLSSKRVCPPLWAPPWPASRQPSSVRSLLAAAPSPISSFRSGEVIPRAQNDCRNPFPFVPRPPPPTNPFGPVFESDRAGAPVPPS